MITPTDWGGSIPQIYYVFKQLLTKQVHWHLFYNASPHTWRACPMPWSVQGRSIIVPCSVRRQPNLSDDRIACSLSQRRLCYSLQVSPCPASKQESICKHYNFFNRASDWLKYFSKCANFTLQHQVDAEIWSTQRITLWKNLWKNKVCTLTTA